MGLPLSVAINIIGCTKNIEKGSVLCLGKQSLGFTVKDLVKSAKKLNHNIDLSMFNDLNLKEKLNQKLFFETLGFKKIDTLDVSDYEGAEILFDLNKQNTPKELQNKYDFIYDGGTLEHLFYIGNALSHLTKMIKRMGIIFHNNPCNGYIDHGFFQVSPTLYFDYYLTNNFKIIYSGLIDQSVGIKVFPVRQDLYRTLDMNFSVKNTHRCVLNFSVQKLNDISEIKIPQQGYYSNLWEKEEQHFYNVEKHIPISRNKLLRTFFNIWTSFPYKLIYFLKSIKKKFLA